MASKFETEFLTLCAWSNFAVAIVVEIADSIFYHTINTSEFEVEPGDLVSRILNYLFWIQYSTTVPTIPMVPIV